MMRLTAAALIAVLLSAPYTPPPASWQVWHGRRTLWCILRSKCSTSATRAKRIPPTESPPLVASLEDLSAWVLDSSSVASRTTTT